MVKKITYMSQSNFTEYLQDLTARIKDLQSQITSIEDQITLSNKEHEFKKNLVKPDIEKQLSNYQASGLGLELPKVDLENISQMVLNTDKIRQTLNTMFKLI